VSQVLSRDRVDIQCSLAGIPHNWKMASSPYLELNYFLLAYFEAKAFFKKISVTALGNCFVLSTVLSFQSFRRYWYGTYCTSLLKYYQELRTFLVVYSKRLRREIFHILFYYKH